jgi:ATP-dependent RNA helicase HelY
VAWAQGELLSSVLRNNDLAPGDFVRNIRQLIDLVRQLAQVAPDPGTAEAATLAVALMRRGVVAADDPVPVGSAPDGSAGS